MSGAAHTPLVSIVVPTYQHAPYIRTCLDSLLAQRTPFPVEILIGEDASTDGTREICQEYAAQHPDLIRLFLNDRKDVIYLNGTPSGRWNVLNLYSHCRGKYIAVCEGDDFWTDPEKLAIQVALLEERPEVSACFHATALAAPDGSFTGKDFRPHVPAQMGMEEVVNGWSPFHLTSIVFRNGPFFRERSAWKREVGSYDLLIFAVAADRGPLVGLPRNMSAYRKLEGGMSNTSAQRGASFEYLRMLVWLYCDRYFKGKWGHLMWPLLDEHYGKLVRMIPRRERLRYFRRLVGHIPFNVVRQPRRYVRWALAAWRGR